MGQRGFKMQHPDCLFVQNRNDIQMKRSILVLGDHMIPETQIAAAWLKTWDPDAEITVGFFESGTACNDEISDEMESLIKEINPETAVIRAYPLEDIPAADWEYVVVLEKEENTKRPPLKGKIEKLIPIKLDLPKISVQNREEAITTLTQIRSIIQNRITDFFLHEIYQKDTLGADSCGVWCDL